MVLKHVWMMAKRVPQVLEQYHYSRPMIISYTRTEDENRALNRIPDISWLHRSYSLTRNDNMSISPFILVISLLHRLLHCLLPITPT